MARDKATDELDPQPAREWQPTSSAWARRQAIAATREAVDRAKRQRTATDPPGTAGTGHDEETT
jgi:hypothetical protein